MALTPQTLSAIQAAGAAIYGADAELKNAAQAYSDQVKDAMAKNPFDIGNDALFEDWKTVARLSQAVTQIELEFKKIFHAASDLSTGALPILPSVSALAAPQVDAVEMEPVSASAEDVAHEAESTVVFPVKKTTKPKRRPTKKAKFSKIAASRPLIGNTLKVWERLQVILNANEFVKLNQTAEAGVIGLPKGSIGASIVKLIQTGHIEEGPAGAFKLVAAKIAPV